MQVQKINTSVKFGNNPQEKFTDKFYTHTKNAADMNDTVVVP